jgi:hypothetical protein
MIEPNTTDRTKENHQDNLKYKIFLMIRTNVLYNERVDMKCSRHDSFLE